MADMDENEVRRSAAEKGRAKRDRAAIGQANQSMSGSQIVKTQPDEGEGYVIRALNEMKCSRLLSGPLVNGLNSGPVVLQKKGDAFVVYALATPPRFLDRPRTHRLGRRSVAAWKHLRCSPPRERRDPCGPAQG
jgi:hypothetical protein